MWTVTLISFQLFSTWIGASKGDCIYTSASSSSSNLWLSITSDSCAREWDDRGKCPPWRNLARVEEPNDDLCPPKATNSSVQNRTNCLSDYYCPEDSYCCLSICEGITRCYSPSCEDFVPELTPEERALSIGAAKRYESSKIVSAEKYSNLQKAAEGPRVHAVPAAAQESVPQGHVIKVNTVEPVGPSHVVPNSHNIKVNTVKPVAPSLE